MAEDKDDSEGTLVVEGDELFIDPQASLRQAIR
jgi:hypothetical protein